MKLDRLKKEIGDYGTKAIGKAELLKHSQGHDLTKSQAIKAKCYDCAGYCSDGTQDCEIESCPLYPFMPYRKGGVRKTRTVSPERIEQFKANMAAKRNDNMGG